MQALLEARITGLTAAEKFKAIREKLEKSYGQYSTLTSVN